jgi:hypothetical protein
MKQYSRDILQTFEGQLDTFLTGNFPGQLGIFGTFTISRQGATQGSAPTTWQVSGFQQSQDSGAGNLQIEGNKNVSHGYACQFIFPNGTDIKEGTDSIITVDGVWKVHSIPPYGQGTVQGGINVYAVRVKANP